MVLGVSFVASRVVRRLAEDVGCSEGKVQKLAGIAKFTTAVATLDVGGLLADHVAQKCEAYNYGSDGEPEYEVSEGDRAELLEEIYSYMEMATAAYEDMPMALSLPQLVLKSQLIRNVSRPSKLLGKLVTTDTEVHVCILRDQTAVFAFRGTEILRDWRSWLGDSITDLHQLQTVVKLYDSASKPVYRAPSELKAHRGFQLALRDVTRTSKRSDNLRLVLEDLGMPASQVKRVVCLGHSLGGALATLCAKWCREVAFPQAQIDCVTIGSPRVGNPEFASDFKRRVVNRSFRVVNKGDLVPCVPHLVTSAGVLHYKHVHGAIFLSGKRCCAWGGARANVRTLSVLDHRCQKYLKSFKKLIETHRDPAALQKH